jgi:hypothetical protein
VVIPNLTDYILSPPETLAPTSTPSFPLRLCPFTAPRSVAPNQEAQGEAQQLSGPRQSPKGTDPRKAVVDPRTNRQLDHQRAVRYGGCGRRPV